MNTLNSDKFLVQLNVTVTVSSPGSDAQQDEFAPIASAAVEMLKDHPDLLAPLTRGWAYYQLSEHFERKSEALDEERSAAWKGWFEALPSELKDQFEQGQAAEIFEDRMTMGDYQPFTISIDETVQ